MHDERGGDEVHGSDDATRPLAVRLRRGRLHRPAQGRVVHAARLLGLVALSRRSATDAAAARRSGCSTAWAAGCIPLTAHPPVRSGTNRRASQGKHVR